MSLDDSPATVTVYADPATRLFHREECDAGPEAIAVSRGQARALGFSECPDCYWRGHDAE